MILSIQHSDFHFFFLSIFHICLRTLSKLSIPFYQTDCFFSFYILIFVYPFPPDTCFMFLKEHFVIRWTTAVTTIKKERRWAGLLELCLWTILEMKRCDWAIKHFVYLFFFSRLNDTHIFFLVIAVLQRCGIKHCFHMAVWAPWQKRLFEIYFFFFCIILSSCHSFVSFCTH